MNIIKFFTLFIGNLLLAFPLCARVVEMKELPFVIDTVPLIKGDIHYAMDIVTLKKLKKKYPQLATMDTTAFTKEPKTRMVLTKAAYIVKKPAGFFDHENIGSEKFIKHYVGDQKVKKIEDNNFKISVLGVDGYDYQMKTFFDSDDISTLPNSKVIRAVTEAKKLDVISQGSTLTMFREFHHFTKYSLGASEVSSVIPLKENKTLIISYTLTAVKKYYAIEKLLKENFQRELEAQKSLINSFP